MKCNGSVQLYGMKNNDWVNVCLVCYGANMYTMKFKQLS